MSRGLSLSRATKSSFHRENIPVMATVHASYHPASMNKMYSMNSARGVSTAHFPAPLSQRSFPVGWCIN
ncbi:hypothetical protein IMY05_014G0118700 [Salix suchowensis]|nr:hypothetical protein IMY05_014G0118700 [Salix suchowensis]